MPEPDYRPHSTAMIEIRQAFPALPDSGWKIRSPSCRGYNCYAWSVCDTSKRWDPSPGEYWPLRVGNVSDYYLDSFLRTYSLVGFRECSDGRFEFGFQKIAIYSEFEWGEELPQHTARQTLFGRAWLSKLGDTEDILHRSTADLEGSLYGRVIRYMKRSWVHALRDPSSRWIRATVQNWAYRIQRPRGV